MSPKSVLPPQKHIRVKVKITKKGKAKFSYVNEDGKPSYGDADVSALNTAICYTLVENNDGLIFASPIIDKHKHAKDLLITISSNGQTLIIRDTSLDFCEISFNLVVVKENDPTQFYVSSDPLIRKVPN